VLGAAIDNGTVALTGLASWCVLTAALAFRRLGMRRWSLSHVTEVVVTSLLIPFLSVYHRVRGGVAFRVAFW
jgi:hypothetical protein